MLFGGGLIAVLGSDSIGYGGAGPLGCITAAFVSCYFWSKQGWEVEDVSDHLPQHVTQNVLLSLNEESIARTMLLYEEQIKYGQFSQLDFADALTS
jgi:hypothetical protein